jgi:hypothetical protein
MTIEIPTAVLSTTDLRRPDVIAGALVQPIVIRDGRTDRLLMLLSADSVDQQQELINWCMVFTRASIELRRENPAGAILGPVSYTAQWSAHEREEFLADFADALAESWELRDNQPVRSFVRVMRHKFDTVPDRVSGRLNAVDAAALRARVSRPVDA